LKTAHFGIKILEAGSEPREPAIGLVSLRGPVNGVVQCGLKRLEAAAIASCFGDFIQKLLGMLDLILRSAIDGRVKCVIEHVLGDLDQLASHREVVDRSAVIGCIDDCRRFRSQTCEILRNR
jgi:hypothetical protein